MDHLFSDEEFVPGREDIANGAVLLRGMALSDQAAILSAIDEALAISPLRHMITPGGFAMSVAMSNCGEFGWVSDRRGYRYEPIDPQTGASWPAMPEAFARLAVGAAQAAGFGGFTPDACLINRYAPGAKMGLHQDRDERDLDRPIVSVSLGIPATFLFGGLDRADPVKRVTLNHGDVVVWGGPSRLAYYGITALKDATHPALGRYRYNLTFRKAG
jgi:alkylated DNA repair protein (DNA oxidative demethylase)